MGTCTRSPTPTGSAPDGTAASAVDVVRGTGIGGSIVKWAIQRVRTGAGSHLVATALDADAAAETAWPTNPDRLCGGRWRPQQRRLCSRARFG